MRTEGKYSQRFPGKYGRFRLLAWILILTLLIPSADLTFARAAEQKQDHLCIHHPEHTRECGYVPSESGVCTHEHDEFCGYIAPDDDTGSGCTHEHDETCGYSAPQEGSPCTHEHDESCGYSAPLEGSACTHQHDGDCGYREAEEEIPCDMGCTQTDGEGEIIHEPGCAWTPEQPGLPCTHEHDESCGYSAPREGSECTHEHDETCGYTPAQEGTPCTHEHDEDCGYTEPEEGNGCTHVHDETCGYLSGEEGHECGYVCDLCVTGWEWNDEEGLLVWNEEEELWGLGLPGTDEENPLTWELLMEMLPPSVEAQTAAGVRSVDLVWNPDDFPESAFEGEYTLTASLSGEYVLTEDAPALEVLAALGEGEMYTPRMKFLNQWSFIGRDGTKLSEDDVLRDSLPDLESKSREEVIQWLKDTVLPQKLQGWVYDSSSSPTQVFDKVGFVFDTTLSDPKYEMTENGKKPVPSSEVYKWGRVGIQWVDEKFPSSFKDGATFTLQAQIPTVVEGDDTYNIYVNSNKPQDYIEKGSDGNPCNKDTQTKPEILSLKVTLRDSNHKVKYLNQWSFIDRDETTLPENHVVTAAMANLKDQTRDEIIKWLKDTVLPMEIRAWTAINDPDGVLSQAGFEVDENQDKPKYETTATDPKLYSGDGYKWGHVRIHWPDQAFPSAFEEGKPFTLQAEIPTVRAGGYTYNVYVNSNKSEDYRDSEGNPSDAEKDTQNKPVILSLSVTIRNIDLVGHTVSAANPGNVTVNLFDYWARTREPSADTDGDLLNKSDSHLHEVGDTGTVGPDPTVYSTKDDWNLGINENHLLLFGDGMIHAGLWNKGAGENCRYGKKYAGMEGIVKNELSPEGYPELNLDMADKILTGGTPARDHKLIKDYNLTGDHNDAYGTRYESDDIQNLSNTVIGTWGKQIGTDTESLQYLFEPADGFCKKAYTDVKGLFQLNNEGYYYYDMRKNFAEFTGQGGNRFILYDAPATTRTDGDQSVGNFFPFNHGEEVFNGMDSQGNLKSSVYCARNAMNHHLGMTVNVDFRQPANGVIHTGTQSQNMTFQFAGDDDVWVFIDDVLVLDLGGIHSELYGTIDFATGRVCIGRAFATKGIPKDPEDPANLVTSTTLRDAYAAAGRETDVSWTGDTFASNTSHTLKMFYLERGNYDSSIALRFNLQPLLYQRIAKVDQNGQPLAGVKFELYPAEREDSDREGNIRCLYTDSADGGKTFYVRPDYTKSLVTLQTDENGSAVFLTSDGSYFNFADRGDRYYVLREAEAPNGYRAQPVDIVLHYDTKTSILSVANRWTTGAYACSVSNVTGPGKINYGELNNGTVQPGSEVVCDREKAQGLVVAVPLLQRKASGSWLALHGSNLSGFYSVPISGSGEDEWRSAALRAALEQARAGNTADWHLDWDEENRRLYGTLHDLPGLASRYQLNDSSGDMHMVYGIISADALKNTGIVGDTAPARYAALRQYLKTHTVEEAFASLFGSFRLLSINQFNRDFRSLIYIPNEQRELRVLKTDPDDAPLAGTRFGLFSDEGCTREAASGVTDANGMLVFSPGGNNTPGQARMVWAGSTNTRYYLKETKAPSGYALNNTVIPIIVGTYSIYADAGDADDGVSVMAGVGRLTQTMRQYAMASDVDITLQDITAFMQAQPGGAFELTGWQDVEDEDTGLVRSMNLHFGRNAEVDYGLHDEDEGKTRKPFFVTDTGFIRARVQQNYDALTGGQYGCAAADVNKDDLGEADLTNLFSLLNIVVVTDQTGTEPPDEDEEDEEKDNDGEDGGEEDEEEEPDASIPPGQPSDGSGRSPAASPVPSATPDDLPARVAAQTPSTGDESLAGLWMLLGGISLAALAVICFTKLRRKKDSGKGES